MHRLAMKEGMDGSPTLAERDDVATIGHTVTGRDDSQSVSFTRCQKPVSAAQQASCVLGHRVKDRLRLGRRGDDRAQDISDGRLLLQCLRKHVVSALDLGAGFS
jgi:hypothetical protein